MNKKSTYLTGKVNLPLMVGARANIIYNGQKLLTSRVIAIFEVSLDRVVFETQNTIYSVSPDVANSSIVHAMICVEA